MLGELKKLKQWVCAREDKIPCDVFGRPASVTDPSTWDTYENCCKADFPHVGFVFTNKDPYLGMDLDKPTTKEQKERHLKILNTFNSYTEKSVSGQGAHIIVRAKIPHGVRKDNVELYFEKRYFIFTEDPIKNVPIADYQETIDTMFSEMHSTGTTELEQIDSEIPDAQIIEMASKAVNKDKFLQLCNGDWQKDYPSQSEADFALISMFAFYSQDNAQVMRLFRISALGKRPKAQRDQYLNYALKKIRARQPTPIETEQIKKAIAQPVQEPPQNIPPPVDNPPGLLGDIAAYITESATRPIREVGLVGAIALCSGLWGRAYNVSGTGLNQYQILLASTGAGKEGARSGIERIISALRPKMPSIENCMGPANFASGQAVFRALDKQNCFVSIIGEFGLLLSQICNQHANAAHVFLKRAFLDLYAQSGYHNVVRSSVYADSDKNTKLVRSPSISLLGESTPQTFFDNLTKELIADGLIPRFLITEYKGKRPPRNVNAGFLPGKQIIDRLIESCALAFQTEQAEQVINVSFTKDAEALLNALDKRADDEINSTDEDTQKQLWNRSHLKALKLAALVAVGVDHNRPVVDAVAAQWAVDLVVIDTESMVARFENGEHGRGNARQEADVRRAMEAYAKLTQAKRRSYKVPKALIRLGKIVPYTYLRRRLLRCASFVEDRLGASLAIQNALKDLCSAQILFQIPEQTAFTEYRTRAALYVRGEAW